MTPAELALIAYAEAHPPREARPVHPGTGCPCAPCDARDSRLEARAEDRAAERRGDYAGLAENAWAEYREEMSRNYWEGDPDA